MRFIFRGGKGQVRFLSTTKAPTKVRALEAALQLKFPIKTPEILSHPCPSRVPEQPLGEEETALGSWNRAFGGHQWVLSQSLKDTYSLGIENGLRFVPEGPLWEDFPRLALILPDGSYLLGSGISVVFPNWAVEEARKRGFGTVTVGSVLAEMTGCPKDDPHGYLTHGLWPRSAILTQAIYDLLLQL